MKNTRLDSNGTLGELISRTQNDVHQKMQENLTAEELQEFERVASIISANISPNR